MYENVSGLYGLIVEGNSRSFRARIKDRYGQPKECEVISYKTYSASSDGNDVTAGKAYAQSLDMRCYTDSISINDEIILESGLVLGDNRIEYIPCGVFTVTELDHDEGVTVVKAYDAIHVRGRRPFVKPGYDVGIDFISVATHIADQLGVIFEASIVGGYDQILIYSDFPDNITVSEAAGLLAGVMAANAYIGRTGRLEFRNYEISGANLALYDRAQSTRISSEMRSISKIVIDYGEGEQVAIGTGDRILKTYNPLIKADETYELAVEALQEYFFSLEYHSGMVNNALGDPRLDPWDRVAVDNNGYILCGSLTTEYDGGLTMNIESYAPTAADEDIDDKGPSESKLDQLEDDIRNSNGLFETREDLPDGSIIYYMHDNKVLEKSLQVWKFYRNGIGLSTDGGESYPYGLIVDENLIQRYARALNMGMPYNQIITELLPTDNLNSYKAPGFYYCANSTDAGNIANCPVKYGFRMEVKLLGSTTRGLQILYPHTTTPEYYMRKWSGNSWYAWHRFSGTAV